MEQLHFITKLLDIKDPNIQILDIINKDTHKEIIAKLDYDAPSCPECGNQLKKYDFQKPSKIPYLETTGMPSRILLRKRRFKCYHCSKMMVEKYLSYLLECLPNEETLVNKEVLEAYLPWTKVVQEKCK
ncbi:transposase [Streptococcus pneumoniae]|nr:transposase [Streptococcus pneumoniae]